MKIRNEKPSDCGPAVGHPEAPCSQLTLSAVVGHAVGHAGPPAGEHVVPSVTAVVEEEVAGAALAVEEEALLCAGVGTAAEQPARRTEAVLGRLDRG